MVAAPKEKQFKIEIYLRSGAKLETRVHNWGVRRNGLGNVVGYEWESVLGWPRIRDLKIDDVSAVLETELP